ncbi:MAG TPA: sensor histidine kinase [Gaiellaceae bacterium]|nr:sensor histidine kinase [Gaiellaceae bacterium]
MRHIHTTKLDALLAVALTAALEIELWLSSNQPHHKLGFAILGPLMTGAIALRRRFPLGVPTAAMLLVLPLPSSSLATWGAAWMIDMYALPAWTRGRRFWVGFCVFQTTGWASLLWANSVRGAALFMIVATIVVVLIRFVVGDRDRRLWIAERERDVAAREAVVEERARIARELHDAIAHSVSMMVIQAGAERRVVEPGSTREVLMTIERIGRDALTEMRRLVGMLRSDAAGPLAPQPGLGDLSTLVSQVREAGLPVTLHVEGEQRELPVGIELSAYRIVQEALTNALKHAGDARADVRVRYGADLLELEIVDDGAGFESRAPGGHGLVGMRERVALYGGRLDTGRAVDGGFTVRALLPIR